MYEKIHGDISRDTRKNDGVEARRRNDEKGDVAVEQMGDGQQRLNRGYGFAAGEDEAHRQEWHHRCEERPRRVDRSASGIPRRCGKAIPKSPALYDFSGRIG